MSIRSLEHANNENIQWLYAYMGLWHFWFLIQKRQTKILKGLFVGIESSFLNSCVNSIQLGLSSPWEQGWVVRYLYTSLLSATMVDISHLSLLQWCL